MKIEKIVNVWQITEIPEYGGWQVERASYSARFETAAEALAEVKRYDQALAKGCRMIVSSIEWTTCSAIGRDVVRVLS